MVDGPADGIRFSSASSRSDDFHGRLPRRLESRIPRPIVARKVATLGSSHQLAGVENSVDGHSTVAVPDQEPVRISAGGQHNSSGLPQEPRRYQVEITVEANKEDRSDRHINWLELRKVLAIQLLQFRIKNLCV